MENKNQEACGAKATDEPRAAPVNPSNPALPLKPGESPEALTLWRALRDRTPGTDAIDMIAAALDRRGEEERAKALESAARTAEDELGDYVGQRVAKRIRSLAAAPSGDAPTEADWRTMAVVLARQVGCLEPNEGGQTCTQQDPDGEVPHCAACAPLEAYLPAGSLGAPSGDAKAAAPETVAEHLARMGSPAHSICSECPQPAGDAKGTK